MDDRILDQILPVPTEEEKMDELFQELQQEGFAITNTRTGGIFYTLVRIFVRVLIELKQLSRTILRNMYVTSAEGAWMELKAADFGQARKLPRKTKGFVTVGRTESGEAVKILKGNVFKTQPDINGTELKYIALQETILQKGALSVAIPVEAEQAGAVYNIPEGQISRSLIHLEGIDFIRNEEDWITQEGADIENIESLRERTLRSWSELSALPIRDKYQNVAESIPGVFHVEVDDQHPRGQGKVDIIVTSTAGAATQLLLDQVSEAIDEIRGPYDNLQIMSSETVYQAIDVTLILPIGEIGVGVDTEANMVLVDLASIRKGRRLNQLTRAEIIYELKKAIPVLTNVLITEPAEDVLLDKRKVLLAGNISVTITSEAV